MKFVVGNVAVRVEDVTEGDDRWLRTFLTFADSGARFRNRRFGGDGALHLYNAFTHRFPTGLLPIVLKGVAEEGGGDPPQVVDERVAPCSVRADADLSWLRDYQREAVAAVHAQGRGILRCPTGSGKTEIAIGLVLSLPCRWLFLVHRTTLLAQAADRYAERTGRTAGRVGDGEWHPDDTLTVATFATIYRGLRAEKGSQERQRALALLASAQGIIVDECHVQPSASHLRVSNAATNAYYRVGMSGTPLDRTDRRSILAVAALGPIVYSIPAQRLVDAGVLARPDIRVVEVRHPETKGVSWAHVYNERVVHCDERNRIVVQCARVAEKPSLVFIKEIEHGRKLVAALERAGLNVEFVYGKESTDQRQAAVRRLVRGDTDVIVCSVVFQEGLDIPSLRSVIIATGGKSVIATLQRIGRGMRKASGKDSFEVWDVVDRGQKWLQRHSTARVKAYRKEGYAVRRVVFKEAAAQATLPGLTTATS